MHDLCRRLDGMHGMLEFVVVAADPLSDQLCLTIGKRNLARSELRFIFFCTIKITGNNEGEV